MVPLAAVVLWDDFLTLVPFVIVALGGVVMAICVAGPLAGSVPLLSLFSVSRDGRSQLLRRRAGIIENVYVFGLDVGELFDRVVLLCGIRAAGRGRRGGVLRWSMAVAALLAVAALPTVIIYTEDVWSRDGPFSMDVG